MRTHETVLEHVQRLLERGELRPGDRLPSERALAAQLGVSRPSLREALRALEMMGVLRPGVGSGPDAGTVLVPDASAGITASLRAHLAAETLRVRGIVDTRLVLETWAVGAAARAPVGDHLADAAVVLDRMDDRDLDPNAFHALDADFHLAVVQAGGNAVVTTIMAALRECIHHYVVDAVPRLPDWRATASRLRREHRRIHRAVVAGDVPVAERALRRHIEGYYREVVAQPRIVDVT